MNAIFCTYNGDVLGIDNKMPWEIACFSYLRDTEAVKEDLKTFRKITANASVVMGRKTWESLNKRILPGRKQHIIITSNPPEPTEYEYINNVIYVTLDKFKESFMNESNLWLIGGAKLFEELIPFCEQVYVSNIEVLPLYNKFDVEDERITSADNIFSKLWLSGFSKVHDLARCKYVDNDKASYQSNVWFKDYRK